MNSSLSIVSGSKYFAKKSFAVLSDTDEDPMLEQTDERTPTIISTKVKSLYHQRCTVPNKDFGIFHNAIGSKLQTTVTVQRQPPGHGTTTSPYSYPSTEFFNKVSTKLRNLRAPLFGEDSETETDGDKNRKRVMDKPMFITTVRSGTFLEPPPEVAALLGLRKNYSTTLTSTTSSSEKSGNEHSMMYSFASRPRVVKAHNQTDTPLANSSTKNENRREKRDVEDENSGAMKDEGSTYYGNTMYDRRVARGSNFASLRTNALSTEHIQSRQAEARRRAAVRQRAQMRARRLRMNTPPPVDGRKHEQMQTEKYWEEIAEKPPEKSIACQADLPMDSSSHSTLSFANSIIRGEDAGTQISPGDLPTYDDQIHTVVTYIVNKILREAILEINEEIENFRCCSYSEKVMRDHEVTFKEEFTDDSTIIVSREELSGLIQAAIQYLKSLEKPDMSLEYLQKMENRKLLEITIEEIRTVVRDVRFISEIIQRQAQRLDFDEHKESSSITERGINSEEITEQGSSILKEEVSTAINQVEASNGVRNLDSQETEAVIVDTDKTDLPSVIQMDDDGFGKGDAEIEEDQTIKDGNEKTEVGTMKEFTNNYEIQVTKNENLKEEEAAMSHQIDNVDEPMFYDSSSPVEEKEILQVEYEADKIELKEPELIPEKKNYPNDDDNKTKTLSLSQTESKVILKSKNSENEPPPQINNGISDPSSTTQANILESQEPKFTADNMPSGMNTEDLANENLGSLNNEVTDTTFIDDRIVSSNDQFNLSEKEKEQSREKRESERSTQVLTRETSPKILDSTFNSSAEQLDRVDLNNENSTKENTNLETGHLTKSEDEIQADQTILEENDISTEGADAALNNITFNNSEREDESVAEIENVTSHSVDRASINDDSVPAKLGKKNDEPSQEVTLPKSGVDEEENSVTKNDDYIDRIETPSTNQAEKEDLIPKEIVTVENEIISSKEKSNLKNKFPDDHSQLDENSMLQKGIPIEEASSKNQKSRKSPPLSGSTNEVNQCREKIDEAKSLESDITNTIQSADITISKRRSSLPNPNYEDTSVERIVVDKNEEEKYTGEITNASQNKKTNNTATLENTQTFEEASTNNVSTEELTNSTIATEVQQTLTKKEENEKSSLGAVEEKSETAELSNQKFSSPVQQVEFRPTSISSTVNATQSSTTKELSHIDKTEIIRSTKLLRHETVSDEVTKQENDLDNSQSLNSNDTVDVSVVQENNVESVQSSNSKETIDVSTTIFWEEAARDLDQRVNTLEKSTGVKSNNVASNEDVILPNTQPMQNEQVPLKIGTFTEPSDNIGGKTKQQSTNTDLDDEEEDSDNIEIEGTRIIEETFTETTKMYKEISIRETTLVEREFFEYSTADDDLDDSPNSNDSSKRSSRESTANDSTKQEIFINIERPLSDQSRAVRTSKLSTDGKDTNSTQNHNGTVLMREA